MKLKLAASKIVPALPKLGVPAVDELSALIFATVAQPIDPWDQAILRLLAGLSGGMPQTRLAAELNKDSRSNAVSKFTAPVMSRRLKRLQRAGLVKRRDDSKDARVKIVSITPRGLRSKRKFDSWVTTGVATLSPKAKALMLTIGKR